jgi:serine/threonine-protein kinase
MLTRAVLEGATEPPSKKVAEVPPEIDAVVMKALAVDPAARYQTALEMAVDLERACSIATGRRVGEWLTDVAKDSLEERARYVADVESKQSLSDPDIQVSVDGEPATKLVAMQAPLSTREPGSVSRAVVTAETMSASPMREPSKLRPALIGAGSASLLAIGLFVYLRESHPAHYKTTDVAAAPPPPPVATVSASAAMVEPAVTPTPVAPTPVASTAAVVPAKATTAPAKVTMKPAAIKTAAPAAAKCDPPYTVDANGVRVPKRECF